MNLLSRESYGDEEDGNGDRWLEVISWEPRAFVYHNFLVIFSDKFLIRICFMLDHKLANIFMLVHIVFKCFLSDKLTKV